MESFEKTAYEAFYIEADFKKVLRSGHTILGDTLVILDKNGNDVSSSIVKASGISGKKILIQVQAGSIEASPYKITVYVTTNLGDKWELDIRMEVKALSFSDCFQKQSFEAFGIGISFKERLRNIAISSQTVTVVDSTALDVSTVVVDQTTLVAERGWVKFRVREGTEDLSAYLLTIRCATAQGDQYERGVSMNIKEK